MDTYQAKLDALGDRTRRAILERLLGGPLPVGKLAEGFPVSRPAVSQHLRVLEHAGLVAHKSAGTRRLYELNAKGFDPLREYFEQFWNEALAAFKNKVEEPSREGDHDHDTGRRPGAGSKKHHRAGKRGARVPRVHRGH